MNMRYLTLIIFLIIYTLVSPARAEYQSGYNPKEEYNCRYSWGSEKVFHKNNDGEPVPLDYPHDLKDVSKEVKKLFSNPPYDRLDGKFHQIFGPTGPCRTN